MNNKKLLTMALLIMGSANAAMKKQYHGFGKKPTGGERQKSFERDDRRPLAGKEGGERGRSRQDGNTDPIIKFEEAKQPERMRLPSPRADSKQRVSRLQQKQLPPSGEPLPIILQQKQLPPSGEPLPIILQQKQPGPQNQAKRDIDSNKQMAQMRSKSAKGPGDSDAEALYQAQLDEIRQRLSVVVDDQQARFDEDKAEMQKKIQKHSSTITQYKQRNAALKAKIDQHNSEIQQKQKTFEIEKQKIQEKNEDLQQRLGESQQAVVQLKQDVADADSNILKERNKNQKQINRYREYGDDLINLDPKDDQFYNKLAELQKKVQDRQERRQQRQAEFKRMLGGAETSKRFAEDDKLKQTMDPDTAQAYKEAVQHIKNRYPEGVDTSESDGEKGIKQHLQLLKKRKFLIPEETQELQNQIGAWHDQLKVQLKDPDTLTPEGRREYHNLIEHARNSEVYLKEQDKKAKGLDNSFGLLKAELENMEAKLQKLEAGEHGEASMQIEGADMFSDEMQLTPTPQGQPQPGGTTGQESQDNNGLEDDMLSGSVHSLTKMQKNQDNKSSRSASTPKRITGNQNNMVD